MPMGLLIALMLLELLWILHHLVDHGSVEIYFDDWQHLSLQLGILSRRSFHFFIINWDFNSVKSNKIQLVNTRSYEGRSH